MRLRSVYPAIFYGSQVISKMSNCEIACELECSRTNIFKIIERGMLKICKKLFSKLNDDIKEYEILSLFLVIFNLEHTVEDLETLYMVLPKPYRMKIFPKENPDFTLMSEALSREKIEEFALSLLEEIKI